MYRETPRGVTGGIFITFPVPFMGPPGGYRANIAARGVYIIQLPKVLFTMWHLYRAPGKLYIGMYMAARGCCQDRFCKQNHSIL